MHYVGGPVVFMKAMVMTGSEANDSTNHSMQRGGTDSGKALNPHTQPCHRVMLRQREPSNFIQESLSDTGEGKKVQVTQAVPAILCPGTEAGRWLAAHLQPAASPLHRRHPAPVLLVPTGLCYCFQKALTQLVC